MTFFTDYIKTLLILKENAVNSLHQEATSLAPKSLGTSCSLLRLCPRKYQICHERPELWGVVIMAPMMCFLIICFICFNFESQGGFHRRVKLQHHRGRITSS
jgi:hypothetical protein